MIKKTITMCQDKILKSIQTNIQKKMCMIIYMQHFVWQISKKENNIEYNERTGRYTSIEIQKYERYIKAKINTLLTFMPEQRSKMHYNLTYEKADYSAALHIADSICFALRGCRDDFFDKPTENDTKRLYDELKTLKNNRREKKWQQLKQRKDQLSSATKNIRCRRRCPRWHICAIWKCVTA